MVASVGRLAESVAAGLGRLYLLVAGVGRLSQLRPGWVGCT